MVLSEKKQQNYIRNEINYINEKGGIIIMFTNDLSASEMINIPVVSIEKDAA